jgi:hypothetical protein
MYNKAVIEFGFCDIPNYQGLGKCSQTRLLDFITYSTSTTKYYSYQKLGLLAL